LDKEDLNVHEESKMIARAKTIFNNEPGYTSQQEAEKKSERISPPLSEHYVTL
jgi:hypothetical protein